MGYSEVVFFRFAAVLFFARSLLRNERAFFAKMIPSDSWAALEPRELALRGGVTADCDRFPWTMNHPG